MNKPRIIELSKIGNEDIGYISVLENSAKAFDIKRVYYTYQTPDNIQRGGHAHKNLEQIIIAVNGNLEIKISTGESYRETFHLSNPNQCLYIPSGFWRDIVFKNNAILLCLASEEYNEDDYIRDYDEFLEWRK